MDIIGWRKKWAGKFGRIEHKAGRLLGFLILINIALFYYKPTWNYYALPATFLCWITYLSAHTLEKKLYGHFGPRG